MMPDLPNVGWERDMESFREFFENPAFRTDGLKVYPTLVIRGTGLYELWKRGLYKNYPPDKVPTSQSIMTGVGRKSRVLPFNIRSQLIWRLATWRPECICCMPCHHLSLSPDSVFHSWRLDPQAVIALCLLRFYFNTSLIQPGVLHALQICRILNLSSNPKP